MLERGKSDLWKISKYTELAVQHRHKIPNGAKWRAMFLHHVYRMYQMTQNRIILDDILQKDPLSASLLWPVLMLIKALSDILGT